MTLRWLGRWSRAWSASRMEMHFRRITWSNVPVSCCKQLAPRWTLTLGRVRSSCWILPEALVRPRLLGFGCNSFDVQLKLLWHLWLLTATRKKLLGGSFWWMLSLRDSMISRLLSAWDARRKIICCICMLIFHSISSYFNQFDICQPLDFLHHPL